MRIDSEQNILWKYITESSVLDCGFVQNSFKGVARLNMCSGKHFPKHSLDFSFRFYCWREAQINCGHSATTKVETMKSWQQFQCPSLPKFRNAKRQRILAQMNLMQCPFVSNGPSLNRYFGVLSHFRNHSIGSRDITHAIVFNSSLVAEYSREIVWIFSKVQSMHYFNPYCYVH